MGDSHRWKLGFVRLEQYLDGEHGTRWLEKPALAQLVVDSLRYFAGSRL